MRSRPAGAGGQYTNLLEAAMYDKASRQNHRGRLLVVSVDRHRAGGGLTPVYSPLTGESDDVLEKVTLPCTAGVLHVCAGQLPPLIQEDNAVPVNERAG